MATLSTVRLSVAAYMQKKLDRRFPKLDTNAEDLHSIINSKGVSELCF
jgi:hypothetical protein